MRMYVCMYCMTYVFKYADIKKVKKCSVPVTGPGVAQRVGRGSTLP